MDKKDDNSEKAASQAPADALSRTPEELNEEKAANEAANPTPADPAKVNEKKLSPLKQFMRKVNLYFLLFGLLIVIAGAITTVNYLNSQKAPQEPNIANQSLTQEALKQLANTDATVGGAAQTLTIQGSAIISGNTLMRGNLNVAGNIQSGGSITGPSITISGQSNFGATQINSLQVAQNLAVQGSTTMRDLNVSGTSSFSGAITASQITVSSLILSGNGALQIPNHLVFSGPSPSRSFIGSGILGSGGSVSVNGSDTSGSISMGSGNNPTGDGCIVRVNFNKVFTTQPRVIVSPVNRAAGQMLYYIERNTTGFSLCTANTPTANQTFAFDYFIAG